MASSSLMISLIIVLALLAAAPAALAKDFVVGDENGWKNNNFDYQAWAKDKDFHVGDRLIFNYKAGVHNVHKVDGAGFRACQPPSDNSEPLSSGNDVVTLSTPGRKWYICGIGSHCESGNQKLLITVKEGSSSSPPPSAAPELLPPARLLVWIAAAVSMLMIIVA